MPVEEGRVAASRCAARPDSALPGTAPAEEPRWFASHELRTPLQAIKGGLELLLEGRGSGLSALQVEAIAMIAGATGDLERRVADLAELAAVEAASQAPLERLRLGDWLAQPSVARHLQTEPGLTAAAGELEVLIVAPLASRAIGHLAAASTGRFACGLAEASSREVALVLEVTGPVSGNGAVAWQLATALLTRAGASVQPAGTMATLVTLRRAP